MNGGNFANVAKKHAYVIVMTEFPLS